MQIVWVQVNTAPKLVLLDVGMVAELTPEDQQNLVGFFKVGNVLLPPLKLLISTYRIKSRYEKPHNHLTRAAL